MTQEITHESLESNPELVAEQQALLGNEWANLYLDPSVINTEVPNSAEIVLRNPSVYLHDIDPAQLPEDLQGRWHDVLTVSDTIANVAATRPHEWGREVTGLEKMQYIVSDGEVNPLYRGSVSDIMRASSQLFAESTKHQPGNTKYYAGNVIGAKNWLKSQLSHRS